MIDDAIKLRQEIMREIRLSKMTFQRKQKMINFLDDAFRNQLGILHLSSDEIPYNITLQR